MLHDYSICDACFVLIELRQGIWWDMSGNCVTAGGIGGAFMATPEMHKHIPANADTYESYKFANLNTEILYLMGLDSWEDEAIGETDGFGYFELFADFCAVVHYDSQGFVYSTIYDTPKMARNAWSHISTDYDEFIEDLCPCGSPNCDYAYEATDEYDSDIYDF